MGGKSRSKKKFIQSRKMRFWGGEKAGGEVRTGLLDQRGNWQLEKKKKSERLEEKKTGRGEEKRNRGGVRGPRGKRRGGRIDQKKVRITVELRQHKSEKDVFFQMKEKGGRIGGRGMGGRWRRARISGL